jgi:hypothetical protein
MNALLRLVLALVALAVPPAVLLVDRSVGGFAVVAAALAGLAVFFVLYAGVGALIWLAAGLVAFWRVLASGVRRSYTGAIA